MNDMNMLFAKNVDVTRKMTYDKVTNAQVPGEYVEIVGHGFQGNIKAHKSIVTGGYPALMICTKVKQNIDTFRDNDTKEERDSIATGFKLVYVPEQGTTAPTVKKA